ncbi:MAG TPA: AAA family ATPase [Candidatus Kapabacteria bacterium]|nr:AAA family ATPase [Candidatus Kapabacteria bacterium]
MNEEKLVLSTKSRLAEIDKELDVLKKQRNEIRQRWEIEKNYIKKIRSFKEEIEQAKNMADEYERQSNLEKVAEIRYSTILNLEKKLNEANNQLQIIQKSGKLLKEEVDVEDIAEIVAKWTGIPVQRMLETERSKLIKMEDGIHQRLINQEEAVSSIANSIRRSRSGLQDANRPIGSFIFLGSTGVGKTEMAKALAEFLFNNESALVRIDMSEYMEKYSVSRLIGAPPGYVGYEEGGQLTEAIRRKPYAVVLLDEIEKAHPEVFNILLQVLDDGRLTDGKGRTVNFKNTIIIMTSNLGTDIIQRELTNVDEVRKALIFDNVKNQILEILKLKMRPEFLNRVDDIILFKPLTKKEINQIARLQLSILKNRTKENGIELKITERALALIATLGFDEQYGARPLKRAIQNHISNPLALKLLSSEYVSGDSIIVDASPRNEFIFYKQK